MKTYAVDVVVEGQPQEPVAMVVLDAEDQESAELEAALFAGNFYSDPETGRIPFVKVIRCEVIAEVVVG